MGIERHWQRIGPVAIALLPLALLFRGVAGLRRLAYRIGLKRSIRARVPVVVVGNITVGGSGKTPLVVWMVGFARELGLRPAIVSRGYGGRARNWPQQVRADSDPFMVGDEAVLLAQRAACPVCVAPDRPQAVQALVEYTDCSLVISDDGLQHYAMARDLEILVIDGQRRFGNRLPLPAGPLREPVSRLRSVDMVICNGEPHAGEFGMQLGGPRVYPLQGGGVSVDIGKFDGRRVRALAGIGNPQRFFSMLEQHGLEVEACPFPDHHAFKPEDLRFDDDLPLLMTEKDAVKCRRIHSGPAWVVRVEADPDPAFAGELEQALRKFQAAN